MRVIVILAILLGGCSRGGAEPVTVFAAASLREVASEAAGTRRVALRCDASSRLARQIREGARADLFLSADPEWVEGLPVLSRFDWLGNRLAVVVRREAADPDLRTVSSLALGAPGVPAGKYARVALESLDLPLPPRVIHGSDVRDVLSKVSEGAAEAGIVYATDAAADPEVRTAFLLPVASHPPIVCVAALLTPKGRDLFEALRGPEALEAARRRGFVAP